MDTLIYESLQAYLYLSLCYNLSYVLYVPIHRHKFAAMIYNVPQYLVNQCEIVFGFNTTTVAAAPPLPPLPTPPTIQCTNSLFDLIADADSKVGKES